MMYLLKWLSDVFYKNSKIDFSPIIIIQLKIFGYRVINAESTNSENIENFLEQQLHIENCEN